MGMRIDASSIHRPTEVNQPKQEAQVEPAAPSARVDVPVRNHFVRERRRKNRRIEGDERRRMGRRQGEQRSAQSSPHAAYASDADARTEGPDRLVDIDC